MKVRQKLLAIRELTKKKLREKPHNPVVGYKSKQTGQRVKQRRYRYESKYRITLTEEGKKEIEKIYQEKKLTAAPAKKTSMADIRAKIAARKAGLEKQLEEKKEDLTENKELIRKKRIVKKEAIERFVRENKTKLFKREEIRHHYKKVVEKGETKIKEMYKTLKIPLDDPIHKFKEYYYHRKGTKVLKTIMNARQFVPYKTEKEIFKELINIGEAAKTKVLPGTAGEMDIGEVEPGVFGVAGTEGPIKVDPEQAILQFGGAISARAAGFLKHVFEPVRHTQRIFRFNYSILIRYYGKVDRRTGNNLRTANAVYVRYIKEAMAKAPRLQNYTLTHSSYFDGVRVPTLEEIVKVT